MPSRRAEATLRTEDAEDPRQLRGGLRQEREDKVKNGNNRICYGLGEFHCIQTKSLINKAIKPEFSVDGGYFMKISP